MQYIYFEWPDRNFEPPSYCVAVAYSNIDENFRNFTYAICDRLKISAKSKILNYFEIKFEFHSFGFTQQMSAKYLTRLIFDGNLFSPRLKSNVLSCRVEPSCWAVVVLLVKYHSWSGIHEQYQSCLNHCHDQQLSIKISCYYLETKDVSRLLWIRLYFRDLTFARASTGVSIFEEQLAQQPGQTAHGGGNKAFPSNVLSFLSSKSNAFSRPASWAFWFAQQWSGV